MTALTVNGSAAAATTLTSCAKMFAATGGTAGDISTKVAQHTQFMQINGKGSTSTATALASIPAPTDTNFFGWMWDVTTLEGQRIEAGTWTPTFKMLASNGGTVTPTVQWFKRSSAGAYTSIGSVTGSSITLTTSEQALTFTPPSLAQMDFATGDKLCMWLWANITVASGSTLGTMSVGEAISGSSAGATTQAQAVTPGYITIVTTTYSFTDSLIATDGLVATDGLIPTIPQQLGQDTFVRANQSGLGTASDTQAWTLVGGTMAASISSNEGRLTGANSDTSFQLGTTTIANAEAVIRFSSPDYTSDVLGPALRIQDSLNWYRPRLYQGNFSLFKMVSGTPTAFANVAFSATNGVFYWVRYQVIGTSHFAKCWADGSAEPSAWTITATDTSFSGAGLFGIEGWSSSAIDSVSFDHLLAIQYVDPDALTVTESATWTNVPVGGGPTTTTYTFIDALTANDSTFLETEGTLLVDALSVSDAQFSIDGNLNLESNAESDLLGGNDASLFTSSLATSEIVLEGKSYIPLDALTATDSDLITSPYLPTDLLTGTSSPLEWDVYHPSDDALTVSDSATWVQVPPSGATNNTYSFTESLVAVDILHVPITLFANPGDHLGTMASTMLPGDTLILNNGTYTGTTLQMFKIFGSLASPITIKAANDGQAIIDGQGTRQTVLLEWCSYIVLDGFSVKNSNDSVVYLFQYNDHITLYRITATGAAAGDFHVFNVTYGSHDILVEDCAAWGRGRYLFIAYHADTVTFRRCYAYSAWTTAFDNAPRSCFGNYGSSNTLFENCIGTGTIPFQSDTNYYTSLWQTSDDTVNYPITNARIWGCVFYNNCMGISVTGNGGAGNDASYRHCYIDIPTSSACATFCTTNYSDPRAIDWDATGGATLSNMTIANCNKGWSRSTTASISLTNSSLYADATALGTNPPTHTFNNFSANTSNGVTLDATDKALAPNYPTATYGRGAYLMPPAALKGQGQSGADIGANILYTSINGTTTPNPLWPWNMESRVMAELGQSPTYAANGGLWTTLAGVYLEWTEALIARDTFTSAETYIPFEAQTLSEKILVGGPAMFADTLSISDTASMVMGSISFLLYLSATWLARDGKATWLTRDGSVGWKTRDDTAAWDTRDDKAAWESRDDTATWKTR